MAGAKVRSAWRAEGETRQAGGCSATIRTPSREGLATALTSNILLSEWGTYLGDATLTAAILDRLTMNAIRLNIDGPSYRRHVAGQRARAYGATLDSDPAS